MKKYVNIYASLFRINFMRYVINRANFGINVIVAYTAWSAMSVINVFLLTSKFTTVYGWSRGELYVLIGAFNIFTGIFDTFFARNCQELFRLTQTGELDLRLTKPVNSQFAVSTWFISYAALVRIITGLIILIVALVTYHISVSLSSIIGFCVLLLTGVVLLYSIWIMFCMVAFKAPELENMLDLLYQTRSFLRYPREVFQQLNPVIFLMILPLTLVVIPPARFLIHKATGGEVVGLIVLAVAMFFFSTIAWKQALKGYTSASG